MNDKTLQEGPVSLSGAAVAEIEQSMHLIDQYQRGIANEVAHIRRLLPSAASQTKAVPSTAQTAMRELAATTAMAPDPLSPVDKAARKALSMLLAGETSLLMRHLHPHELTGASGYIQREQSQGAVFGAYHESAYPAAFNIVRDWPDGFYRSESDAMDQFLVKHQSQNGLVVLICPVLPYQNAVVLHVAIIGSEPATYIVNNGELEKATNSEQLLKDAKKIYTLLRDLDKELYQVNLALAAAISKAPTPLPSEVVVDDQTADPAN